MQTFYFWFFDKKEGLYKLQSIQKCKSFLGTKRTRAHKLCKHLFENCPYVTQYGIANDVNTHEIQMALHRIKVLNR